MSRITLLNLLENVFQPSVNQAMREDLIGSVPKVTDLASETTLEIDFTENRFQVVNLGAQNISALTAVVTNGKDSLKAGEVVLLKIVQDATGARTLAFSTNFLTDVTISSSTNDVDILLGVFDGTNILLGALMQKAI